MRQLDGARANNRNSGIRAKTRMKQLFVFIGATGSTFTGGINRHAYFSAFTRRDSTPAADFGCKFARIGSMHRIGSVVAWEMPMTALLTRRLMIPLALALLVGAADVCLAQGGRYRGYGGRYSSPYGPTLSPYLDYFRRDTGVLDPYNAFIRPRRQLQNQLANIVEQEQAENARLRQQIQGVRAAEAAPTGTGGTFLNYSHYYPSAPAGTQGRRR
jgi:hypothetical protein